MALNTNMAPAQPFLVKPAADGSLEALPGEIVNDTKYLYQATSYKNLASIKTGGLDPSYGGKGGSGAVVGGADGAHFNHNSQGKVHGTSASTTANFYALMKDSPATFVRAFGSIGDLDSRPEPTKLADFAIILRFRKDNYEWEVDPDDPRNAFCTRNKIPPFAIEGLTTEGWVKIMNLTGLDRALSG